MKFKKETESINSLLSVAEFGVDPERGNEPFRAFGMGEYSIVFRGLENYTFYQNQIEFLFTTNKEINESYTIKKFENSVIDLIRTLHYEKRDCTLSDIGTLFKALLSVDLANYEVFNEFFGATSNSPEIHFGDFTIYNLALYKNELYKKYPLLQGRGDLYLKNINANLLIGINVKAREQDKANEIADNNLKIFENVMSYVIADLSHHSIVGLFNFTGRKTKKSIICTTKTIGSESNTLNMFIDFDLENPYLKSSENGNDKIWPLITNSNKTEIEKRLLNSAEWIGKAVYEKDYSKSLFQFVVSIEGMLQFNEKTLITPSIVSQLSEWLAFIIEEESEKRKSISKYFKDIYQKRSAIAHGGLKYIEKEDLNIALQISKLMIISFLTKEPFKSFVNLDQLNNHITDLKFK